MVEQVNNPTESSMTGVVVDQHQCQCKHCGKMMWPAMAFYITPVPEPPACAHEWRGISIWSGTDGEHGSRKCVNCGLYQQW